MAKEKLIVEHNSLVAAQYDMTAAEQNIVCMLLRQLQQEDPVDKAYSIYVKDIEEITTRKIDYQKVRRSARNLLSRIYTLRDHGDILEVCMISSVRYIKDTGKIVIRIDPEIRPYLFALKKHFTKYRFRMFMALKSKYAKRIYKMLCQFRSTGVMHISVDELKTRLNLFDPKTGKEQYKEWPTFINRVLKVAQEELAEHTDIHFTYEAKKTGRKFTELEFKIMCVPDQLPCKYGTDQVVTDIYRRLTSEFKLSTWQAHLIAAHVPEEDIHRTLYEIKLKKLNGELSNVGGFTAQTFENKYQLGLVGGKAAGLERPTPVGEHPRASKSKPLGGA